MRRCLRILAALVCAIPLAASAETFPRPAALETPIRFWRDIFGVYSRHQVVVHDAENLDRIYSVVDLREAAASGMSAIELERLDRLYVDAELDRLRTLFGMFGSGWVPEESSPDERRIWNLFANDMNPSRFIDAVGPKRLRTQRGLRERFGHGVRVAKSYQTDMEAIFREEGLPVELTRLPLIESCFNVAAYSKVGAAGIWQFMPSTGRRFMEVGALVDQRRDPIAATWAAARFLGEMYEDLGSWPLAITAYNHGPAGIARAVSATGTTDIAEIIRTYKGPSFGFASRNFYVEFLAALDVFKHHAAYFGPLEAAPRPETEACEIDHPVGIDVAAQLAGTDRDTLATLNPALTPAVVDGNRAIPQGYDLRVPPGRAGAVEAGVAELAAERAVMRTASPSAPSRRKGRSTAVARPRSRSGRSTASRSSRSTKTVARKTTTKRAPSSKASKRPARTSSSTPTKRGKAPVDVGQSKRTRGRS